MLRRFLRASGAPRPLVSQTGFSGETGYEIYLKDATLHAERLWNAVLAAVRAYRERNSKKTEVTEVA